MGAGPKYTAQAVSMAFIGLPLAVLLVARLYDPALVGPLLLRLPAASNVYWQSKVYGQSDVYWQFVGAGPWTPGRVKRRVGVG